LRGHQLLQAGFPARGQQGFASALVSLGLQRAAFLELLPDPPHGGHTKTKKLRNVIGAFALLIEVDDPFADRQWDGSHGHTLPRRHPRVKLHVLWNCSSDENGYIVFSTELEAQKEIVDNQMTRLRQFLDGEREYEDAIGVEEYVMPVILHPDGKIIDEHGRCFGPEVF
jgi:hypothetical protein